MAKRIFLLLAVNILVMITISVVLSLLRVSQYFPQAGLAQLAVICLVWGFAGAFISLGLSRLMAKWMMGVRVIPANTNDPVLRQLVEHVHELSRQANLPAMPEVGIYESPDVNAFATGPTRARSLVAVSTGLLSRMRQGEVSGVLAHEVAHIANGDMVTMTLVQGVINAFALFLSRVLAFVVAQALRSRDERGGYWIQFLLSQLFYVVFSILGAFVVCWFSRRREFRADAGGAQLAGRENMIGALRALQRLHNPEVAAADARHNQSFQAFKISGARVGIYALLSTHPPLEARIEALQKAHL